MRDVGSFGAEAGFDDALPSFATVRRGYDPAQVRAAFGRLAEELRRARLREEDLRDRVRALESRPPPLPQELDEETLVRALGEETASVLRSAREAARELREHAAAEAERVREVAVAEAERLRAEAHRVAHATTEEAEGAANEIRRRAEAEADRTVAEARREADRLIEQARAEGQALLRKAQEMRTSVLADLAERRRILTAQVDALRAGRDSLVDSFRATRAALDRIDENLARAEIDAKLAADRAGPRPVERIGRPSHAAEPGGAADPIEHEAPERIGGREESRDSGPVRSPFPGPGTSGSVEGTKGGSTARPEGVAPAIGSGGTGVDAVAVGVSAPTSPTQSVAAPGDSRPDTGPSLPLTGSGTASWPDEAEIEGVRILGARRVGDRVDAEEDRPPRGPGGDGSLSQPEVTPRPLSAGAGDVAVPTSPDPAAEPLGVGDGAELSETAPGRSEAGSPPDTGSLPERGSFSDTGSFSDSGSEPNAAVSAEVARRVDDVVRPGDPVDEGTAAVEPPARSFDGRSGGDETAAVEPTAELGVTAGRLATQSGPTGTAFAPADRPLPGREDGRAEGRGDGVSAETGGVGRPGSPGARRREDERAEEVDALFARLRAERATPPATVRAELAGPGETGSGPSSSGLSGGHGRPGGAVVPPPRSSASAGRPGEVGLPAGAPGPDEEEIGPRRPDLPVAPPGPGSRSLENVPEDGLPSDEVQGSEEGPEPAAAPLDAEERGALDRRDQLLAPVAAGVARRVRRILQDEQNQLLDLLRHLDGPVIPRVQAELEAAPERHRASLQQLFAPAFGAGLESAGGRRRRGPSEEDVTRKEAARLLETLTASVVRRVEAGGNDADAVAATLSGAFREWRGERVETLVLDHVLSVFEAAQLAAARREAAFRWVPSDDGGACSDCDDDRLAGPVKAGAPFPTGHIHPPAHSGCRCHLLEVRL